MTHRRKGVRLKSLFPSRAFPGFGPTSLNPLSTPPLCRQVHGRHPGILRQGIRQHCPRQPGVYGMVDDQGELIYIGKAKCLRTRLASYFRANSRDPKAGRILARTRLIAWELAPSEFAALLRELELIRRWQPRFNVHGQPGRRSRTYVCVGRSPAPYLFLAARPPATAMANYGPILAGQRAREAIRRCNDWFRLRDCPKAQAMVFADQGELFPLVRAAGCLRYEIGTCLGPCAGGCSRRAYSLQVRAARAFLEGTDLSVLQTLERDMALASMNLQFERAVALRDKLDSLRWLHHQLEMLRQARAPACVIYPVAGCTGQDLWYLVHQGRIEAVLPLPRDSRSHRAALIRIEALLNNPAGSSRPGGLAEEIDGVLLVAAWFRRHPQEQARTLPVADALALCRGGIGSRPPR